MTHSPTLAPEWLIQSWFNSEKPLLLSGLRGRVIALCAFQVLCRDSTAFAVPQALRIHATFEPSDVAVIGLHATFEHHAAITPAVIKAYLHEYRIKFPVGLDLPSAHGPIPQTMEAYRMRGTPSLVLIDRQGHVRKHSFGPVDDLRLGAEIGAPPDPLALKGQGWGLPPQDPHALRERRLAPFERLMRNNMRYYGALRFDHVMALFRQWWVPAGQSPAQGAYVHYPMHEFMAALSLASHRHRCLVIGEDLGVVPDEIRAAMQSHRLLHYKVLLFEKTDAGFRAPADYDPQSLATPSTHDMPTLRSYWQAQDIELRSRLNLYPDEATRERLVAERDRDREALLAALRAQFAPHFALEATLTKSYEVGAHCPTLILSRR